MPVKYWTQSVGGFQEASQAIWRVNMLYDFPDVVEAQVFVSVIESVAEAPNSTYMW